MPCVGQEVVQTIEDIIVENTEVTDYNLLISNDNEGES